MNKIKLVFLATPDIALESFKFFINSADYEVLALVTQKAKAQNRGKKISPAGTIISCRGNISFFLFQAGRVQDMFDGFTQAEEEAPKPETDPETKPE